MALDQLIFVHTLKGAYVGYAAEDDKYLHLKKAATVPESLSVPNDLALAYFSEKARRNLADYDVPLTAVVEKRHDAAIERMVLVYSEMSRAANKSVAGRIKIARLKKFMQGERKSEK